MNEFARSKFTRRSFLASTGAALTLMAAPSIIRAQESKGRPVVAQIQHPPSLEPGLSSAEPSRNLYFHIYELLFTRDEQGAIIPELAESESHSDDFTEFRIVLRRDVPFHNGKTLVAADVVASLERYRQLGLTQGLMQPIGSIEAINKHEILVRAQESYPAFLYLLSSPRAMAGILPEEEALKGRDEAQPIGTGPFQLRDFQPDSHLSLDRFADYQLHPSFDRPRGFGGRKEVMVDGVEFRFVVEDGARSAGLRAGEIDLVERLPASLARALAENGEAQLFEMLPWAAQLIRFNHATQFGGNVDFRRAIMALVRCEEAMAIAYDGIYDLDPGFLYPGHPNYVDVGAEHYCVEQDEKAQKLLEESGYNGETVYFAVDSAKGNNESAVVTAQHMRNLGINVELKVSDYPSTIDTVLQPDERWHFWTHSMGIEPFEGPLSVLQLFSGPNHRHFGRTDAFDDVAARLRMATSDQETSAAFLDFQETMYDQAHSVKLGNLGITQAASLQLNGFEPFRVPRMWGVSVG